MNTRALLVTVVACCTGLGACKKVDPAPTDTTPKEEKGVCEGPRATPLRLLTRKEYNNSVRDLLGDASSPANALPREPVALGFENNADVLQATTDAVARYLDVAELTAAAAVRDRKSRLVSCATQDLACGQRFVETYGRRLFRRTLEADEKAALNKLFGDALARDGFDVALEWTLAAMLQSPQFLYRTEVGQDPDTRKASMPLSSWDLASKLSYFVWASAPDDELLDAAERGDLLDSAKLEAQARRLLNDPKATDGVVYVLNQLFNTSDIGGLEKNATVYPAWNPGLAASVQKSFELYLAQIAGRDGTLPALLTSPTLFVDDKMSAYATTPGAPTFTMLTMPTQERVGVLTQPGFLARLAGPDQSSPIRRGIFVLERLMCQPPRPPPGGVAITAPPLRADMTTRERFAQHSADPSCAGCHRLIDSVGFGFEHYDGLGVRRDMDNGKPVDASGDIIGARDGSLLGPYTTVATLAGRLAGSRQVHDCMASHFVRFALGRADGPEDECSVKDAQAAFFASGGKFKDLELSIILSASFRTRETPEVWP